MIVIGDGCIITISQKPCISFLQMAQKCFASEGRGSSGATPFSFAAQIFDKVPFLAFVRVLPICIADGLADGDLVSLGVLLGEAADMMLATRNSVSWENEHFVEIAILII